MIADSCRQMAIQCERSEQTYRPSPGDAGRPAKCRGCVPLYRYEPTCDEYSESVGLVKILFKQSCGCKHAPQSCASTRFRYESSGLHARIRTGTPLRAIDSETIASAEFRHAEMFAVTIRRSRRVARREDGRGGLIRTGDLPVPNRVLCQTEPHLDGDVLRKGGLGPRNRTSLRHQV